MSDEDEGSQCIDFADFDTAIPETPPKNILLPDPPEDPMCDELRQCTKEELIRVIIALKKTVERLQKT